MPNILVDSVFLKRLRGLLALNSKRTRIRIPNLTEMKYKFHEESLGSRKRLVEFLLTRYQLYYVDHIACTHQENYGGCKNRGG